MPNNKEHCEDSIKRYGYNFKEIHRWMDEPSNIIGKTHRKYRHDPHTTPKKAEQIFWNKVPERYRPYIKDVVLDHIRLDKHQSQYQIKNKNLSDEVKSADGKATVIIFLLLIISLSISVLLTLFLHDLVIGIVLFFSFWLFSTFALIISNILSQLEKDALADYTFLALKYIGYILVILILALLFALLSSSKSKKSKAKFPKPPKRESAHQSKLRRNKFYYMNR